MVNCDALFHSVLLHDLLTSRHDDELLLAHRQPHGVFGDEEMKVRRGQVSDISKEMDPDEADGENLGNLGCGPRGDERLVEIVDCLVTLCGARSVPESIAGAPVAAGDRR